MTGYRYGAVNENKRIKKGMEVVSQGNKYIVATVLMVDHGTTRGRAKPKPHISAHPISKFGKPRIRTITYLGLDWVPS